MSLARTVKPVGESKAGLMAMAVFMLLTLFAYQARAESNIDYTKNLSEGVSYSGAKDPTGSIKDCSNVWKNNGKEIEGGEGGLQVSGKACFSGGGQSFCAVMKPYLYTCADIGVTNDPGVDNHWMDFDVKQDKMTQKEEKIFYSLTTRDTKRGRAGYDDTLFMNAFDICRSVNNTAKKLDPVFMGVSTPEEWRTVHGVPAGGNKTTGGFSTYANSVSASQLPMKVCCSPVMASICGVKVPVGYANMNDEIKVWAKYGFATMKCVGNNDWRTVSIKGMCEQAAGSGPGGGSASNARGYHNAQTGGMVSASTVDGMSAAAKSALSAAGYGQVSMNTPTNKVGAAAVNAANAAAAANAANHAKAAAAQKAANKAAADKAKAQAKAAADKAKSDSKGKK